MRTWLNINRNLVNLSEIQSISMRQNKESEYHIYAEVRGFGFNLYSGSKEQCEEMYDGILKCLKGAEAVITPKGSGDGKPGIVGAFFGTNK